MPVNLRLEFYGEAQLSRRLERITDAVADARPAWEVIAD